MEGTLSNQNYCLLAELAIGNIVRRVLHIIREEAQQEELDAAQQASSSSNKQDVVKAQVSSRVAWSWRCSLHLDHSQIFCLR